MTKFVYESRDIVMRHHKALIDMAIESVVLLLFNYNNSFIIVPKTTIYRPTGKSDVPSHLVEVVLDEWRSRGWSFDNYRQMNLPFDYVKIMKRRVLHGC